MVEVAVRPRRGAILVVEDHQEVRVGVTQLLALNGFLVADAADAEHAIDHLRAYPHGFALMLLDLLLPLREHLQRLKGERDDHVVHGRLSRR